MPPRGDVAVARVLFPNRPQIRRAGCDTGGSRHLRGERGRERTRRPTRIHPFGKGTTAMKISSSPVLLRGVAMALFVNSAAPAQSSSGLSPGSAGSAIAAGSSVGSDTLNPAPPPELAPPPGSQPGLDPEDEEARQIDPFVRELLAAEDAIEQKAAALGGL